VNKQLASLIFDYQGSVRTAAVLMQRSGIRMPFSSAHWVETDIPACGELEGGIHYFKHGFGCAVSLSTGEVDFDFGEQGEIGGFDVWRLIRFAGVRLAEYGFDTEDALKECFNAAVTAGSLVYSGRIHYYVANFPRSLAVEVDSRLPDDDLPRQDQDPVLVLYAHYFLAADLMQENYKNLDNKWEKRGRLSRNDNVKLGIYLSSWLGFLGVTCEGFNKLRMRLLLQENRPERFRKLISKSDSIGSMLKQHSDSLREFRNNVFHLRKDVEAIQQFFAKDAERLQWAGEIHTAIAEFFSDYRILCEVHYVIHGRRSEMNTRQIRPKRRKMNVS
jgi:hypothetical protein